MQLVKPPREIVHDEKRAGVGTSLSYTSLSGTTLSTTTLSTSPALQADQAKRRTNAAWKRHLDAWRCPHASIERVGEAHPL